MRNDGMLRNKEIRNICKECSKIVSVIKNDCTEMRINKRLC